MGDGGGTKGLLSSTLFLLHSLMRSYFTGCNSQPPLMHVFNLISPESTQTTNVQSIHSHILLL